MRCQAPGAHPAPQIAPQQGSAELLDHSVYREYQLVLVVEREKVPKADRNDRECCGTVGVVRNSNSIENSMNVQPDNVV